MNAFAEARTDGKERLSGEGRRVAHRIAPGERIYALGDLHGRADLFREMLLKIREDNEGRRPAVTRIIVLGDVVDRGPDSAELLRRLMRYTQASDRFTVLRGNHEAAMEAVLAGRLDVFDKWLEMGGTATLRSFGLPVEALRAKGDAALRSAGRRVIPREVFSWIRRLPLFFRSGDVFFVHAGIRPGVPLSKQAPEDLLWIRKEFLESQVLHPVLVVHGHTVVEAGPQVRSNRIGIDTGAFETGRLTAIGLEASERWFLAT